MGRGAAAGAGVGGGAGARSTILGVSAGAEASSDAAGAALRAPGSAGNGAGRGSYSLPAPGLVAGATRKKSLLRLPDHNSRNSSSPIANAAPINSQVRNDSRQNGADPLRSAVGGTGGGDVLIGFVSGRWANGIFAHPLPADCGIAARNTR